MAVSVLAARALEEGAGRCWPHGRWRKMAALARQAASGRKPHPWKRRVRHPLEVLAARCWPHGL